MKTESEKRKIQRAHKRAEQKGTEAFAAGGSRENNPYKHSSWGTGASWEQGWDYAYIRAGKS